MKYKEQFEAWDKHVFKVERDYTVDGDHYKDPIVRELYQGWFPSVVGRAAIATLEHLGYTYHGGEQWKPPLGKPPVRHKKTGGLYQPVGAGLLQTDEALRDMDPVVVYRSIADGKLWVRDAGEFLERFDPV